VLRTLGFVLFLLDLSCEDEEEELSEDKEVEEPAARGREELDPWSPRATAAACDGIAGECHAEDEACPDVGGWL